MRSSVSVTAYELIYFIRCNHKDFAADLCRLVECYENVNCGKREDNE